MTIIWQEYKLLDKSTNHSTETEMIKQIKNSGHNIRYYCSYKYKKLYFDLDDNTIHYLSVPKIKLMRSIIFLFKLFCLNIYLVSFRYLQSLRLWNAITNATNKTIKSISEIIPYE